MNRIPPKLLRRLLMDPVAFGVAAAFVLAFPVLAVLAFLVDLAVGRRRTLRALVFCTVYCAYEVAGLVAAAWLWLVSGAGHRLGTPTFQRRHYRLMAWWLKGLRSVAMTLFGVRIEVEDPPEAKAGPILVLSRHGGAGNSLMLIASLMLEYGRQPRTVMLEKLQWEPFFDVLLNRVPNGFIGHGIAGREAQIEVIARLASGLGRRDALVLFPEGHDFSLDRRRRAIAHLRRRGHIESAESAERLRNVLAPRHGGVIAAVGAAPDADVIFVAHTVFEDVGSLAQLWRRFPLEKPVRARSWRVPAADVPHGREDVIAWLYAWWGQIDSWVSEHTAQPPVVPGDFPPVGIPPPEPEPRG